MQALIHHWHTQSSVHALRLPPEILLLRFVRYSLHMDGAHKNSAMVEWGETLNLPCFLGEHTCDSHNISYTVEAAILHAGQTSLPDITPPVFMPQARLTTVMTAGLPDSRNRRPATRIDPMRSICSFAGGNRDPRSFSGLRHERAIFLGGSSRS